VIWRGQRRLAELSPVERVTRFGIEGDAESSPEDFTAYDLTTPIGDPTAGSSFTLLHEGASTPVELGVRGEHNVLNALAALAAIETVGLDCAQAASTLASFRGVARRFEPLGESTQGARVYDDYAHHPTEVRAALTTARATAGGGRVIAVFQPHLYSRTASLARDFGRALALADVAIVMDVYPAREEAADFPGVSGWMVATATADARPGMRVLWQPGHGDAAAALARELRAGDLCITVGAGDVTQVGHALVEGGA
jgi:UDP-N-acetylmuramate--alanine ligase